jgi:hypothetical protein
MASAPPRLTLVGEASAPASPLPPSSPDALKRSMRVWTAQIVEATRRAEAAEGQSRRLAAELAEARHHLDALGRHFGRAPGEDSGAFAARLGLLDETQPSQLDRLSLNNRPPGC